MKKIWSWLVKSSNDPQKVALTVKGGVLAILPTIIALVAFSSGVEIPESKAIEVVGQSAEFIGLVLAGLGLARKIYLTVKA